MELSPTTITLGLAIIAAIVYVIRQEGKANTIATKVAEHDTDLYKHIENWEIHHRAEELDRRFDELKAGIEKIDSGVEKLSERIDRLIAVK